MKHEIEIMDPPKKRPKFPPKPDKKLQNVITTYSSSCRNQKSGFTELVLFEDSKIRAKWVFVSD